MPPETYADVLDRQARERAQARLDDPAEHFPYKHHVVTGMLAESVALGPGVPGEVDGDSDSSRTIHDYMSTQIADATRDYVEAQAAWLADPDEVSAAVYDAARDRLVAARRAHRTGREAGFTVGAAARRAV